MVERLEIIFYEQSKFLSEAGSVNLDDNDDEGVNLPIKFELENESEHMK